MVHKATCRWTCHSQRLTPNYCAVRSALRVWCIQTHLKNTKRLDSTHYRLIISQSHTGLALRRWITRITWQAVLTTFWLEMVTSRWTQLRKMFSGFLSGTPLEDILLAVSRVTSSTPTRTKRCWRSNLKVHDQWLARTCPSASAHRTSEVRDKIFQFHLSTSTNDTTLWELESRLEVAQRLQSSNAVFLTMRDSLCSSSSESILTSTSRWWIKMPKFSNWFIPRKVRSGPAIWMSRLLDIPVMDNRRATWWAWCRHSRRQRCSLTVALVHRASLATTTYLAYTRCSQPLQ